MNMGQAFNFPAVYLDRELSFRLEISFVLGVVAVLLLVILPKSNATLRNSSLASSYGKNNLRIKFQKILGIFWIIDGLLQAQSDMPRGFIPMVV